MKDSILVGAANAAGLQSKDNKPSGNTREGASHGEAHTSGKYKNVDLTATHRNPTTNRNFEIGLNTPTLIKQKSNSQGRKENG